MRLRWVLLGFVLAGCGGGSEVATTTTTLAAPTTAVLDCPETFDPGDELPDECKPSALAALAAVDGFTLEPGADAQAESICLRLRTSGVAAGFVSIQSDWDSGVVAEPSDHPIGYFAAAIAVYCPDMFEEFLELSPSPGS
jgi:hypothetical protein